MFFINIYFLALSMKIIMLLMATISYKKISELLDWQVFLKLKLITLNLITELATEKSMHLH